MDLSFANEEKIVRVLYENVSNIDDLRKLVLTAGLPLCLIKPKMIVDDSQLSVAVTRALYNRKDHNMTTESLHSEIIYCLIPSKNITESLRTFGIEDGDTEVVIIGEESIYLSIKDSIKGKEIDISNVSKFTDLDAVLTTYQITKEDLQKSSLLDSVITRMSTKDYNLCGQTNTRVIFMLGMAGSGKTTFTQRLAAHLLAQKKTPYILNFDPACEDPPFPVNIDIRDTVDFKKVMQQYSLGPNGGIVTSLNLFTTLFDKVMDIVKLRSKSHEYILVDTPGQLECFLWSASGQIMLHSFAACFPTIVTYVTDLVVCQNPITFASNMMYGVTILYKSKLPMIIALNKADLDPSTGRTVSSWITDFEVVEQTLNRMQGYSVTLSSSITLSLEEFYKVIQHCIVSAADGYGFKEYEKAVDTAVDEYNSSYKAMHEEMILDYKKNVAEHKENDLARFRKDFQKTTHDELFSMQATSTLTQGIDILPHDSDDEDTSDSEEDCDRDEGDSETIGDFRTKESAKRENKRNATISLAGTSSGPQV